jgi:hypothetical protein
MVARASSRSTRIRMTLPFMADFGHDDFIDERHRFKADERFRPALEP